MIKMCYILNKKFKKLYKKKGEKMKAWKSRNIVKSIIINRKNEIVDGNHKVRAWKSIRKV